MFIYNSVNFYFMNCLKYILFFCLCPFSLYADQNDKRLDDLFFVLAHTKNESELKKTTESIWEIWLETNDPVIEYDFKMGLNLMRTGQLKESIKIFTKVIENKPNFAEAWNKRATVYYLIGDFDSSVIDIRQTLQLEPRHFGAMDGLGLIFIHLQQFEKAIEVYDNMLKIFPYNSFTIRKQEQLIDFFSKSI